MQTVILKMKINKISLSFYCLFILIKIDKVIVLELYFEISGQTSRKFIKYFFQVFLLPSAYLNL